MALDDNDDNLMQPRTGKTRDGTPLSFNRAPAEDLSPWVARMVAAKIDASPDLHINCAMCSDVVYIRSLLGGHWTAETADGHRQFSQQTLLFGPHSHAMPITCNGPIMTGGIALRPGALHAITGISQSTMLDRIDPCDNSGLLRGNLGGIIDPDLPPEAWLDALEQALRYYIGKVGAVPPSPISTEFETAAFRDPTISVSGFAAEHNISERTLQRIVLRDFGSAPKQVLRRARALDMGARLCGVADEDEAEELMLRYFDQSHMIREFMAFFGVPPREFRSQLRPLMTISLETRQARRLEVLERLAPGQIRPWQYMENSPKGV